MKINRSFYQCDGVELAKKLLGCVLVHKSQDGTTKGKIVETEAYMGKIDKAAHSYKLGSTRANVQYGKGGFAYVYLIYGMHNCFNVVANKTGIPECVLIRALEPVGGIELMQERRNMQDVTKLCNGPGKLCKAMDITRGLYGADLCGDRLFITSPQSSDFEIAASKRINIDYAEEAVDYLWRFTIKESEYLSIKEKQI